MSDVSILPGSRVYMKWAFTGENEDELTIQQNETAVVEVVQDDEWISIRSDATGRSGLVPVSYVALDEAVPSEAPVASSGTFGGSIFDELNAGHPTAASNPVDSSQMYRSLPLVPSTTQQQGKVDKYDPPSSSQSAQDELAQRFAALNQASAPAPDMDAQLSEELSRRFGALKKRFEEIDAAVPVAEVVHEEPRAAPTPTAPLTKSPSSVAAEAAAAEAEADRRAKAERERKAFLERRESERMRLQKESELRAQQEADRVKAEEEKRKAALEAEFDRIRRHSAVLGKGKVGGADYIQLANQKYQDAAVSQNAKRYDEAFAGYKVALDYLHKAFEQGQVTEKAKTLADMELILDILSKTPFSTDGSFSGKLDILAKMCVNGYDVIAMGKEMRDRGEHYEQINDLSKALAHYKSSAEYFLAFNKGLVLRKQVENATVKERVVEILDKCEELKRRIR